MKKLTKDFYRELGKTKSKFISLVIIIFLGVFVFVGLEETPPTMQKTLNRYFNIVNMYDLKVRNNFGLTEEDVTTIKTFEKIENLETYTTVFKKDKNTNIDIEVQTLPKQIAKPILVGGKLPESENEIVLTQGLENNYKIGDTIEFQESSLQQKKNKNTLKTNNFKIVGFVNGVDYPENNTKNDASKNYFGYIFKENFDNTTVTGVNITLKDVERTDYTSQNYYEAVNKERDKLIELLAKQSDKNEEEFKNSSKKMYKENLVKIQEQRQQLANLEEDIEQQKSVLKEDVYLEYRDNIQNNKSLLEKELGRLENGKKQLDDITYPRFSVANIKVNAQYRQFIESGHSLKSIANIFSGFLFGVALFVTLTTLTRMVDENRTNIGTLKALGYTNIEIATKYYKYGFLAAFFGVVAGIIGGYQIIVPIIYNSYAKLLTFSQPIIAIRTPIILIAILLAFSCIALAIYIPLLRILKEKSAYLLRPKSPKTGERILLEHIPFVWKRLSFLSKVTFRNIFRYKIRMLMTILGILGCLALMFLGFGIRFSVANTADDQFKNIFKYDVVASYSKDISKEEQEKLATTISSDKNIENILLMGMTEATIEKDNELLDTLQIATLDTEKAELSQFFGLKNENGELTLGKEGIIIGEKLAYLHNLKRGSHFKVIINDKEYELIVADIATHYFGHIGYMSKEYYEKVIGKEHIDNTFLIKTFFDKDKAAAVVRSLEENENIYYIQNNADFQNVLLNVIKGIDIIVVVIVFCSVTLALVVLYNLININVAERIRELSTIKVLGFYSREVTMYISREIFYLAFLGIILGNICGKILYQKIILDLAAREMMFERNSNRLVYASSTGITVLILIIVIFIMYVRLKKVNMVEALKAVE